jgi:probable O-glycosylation ligase (exosortase A-associated)
MRDLLLIVIVLASVPVTLLQPFAGVLVWQWVSLMNPHRMTWDYAYDLRVALIVGATTIVAWVASRESKYPPAQPPVYWLIGFALWITLSTWFALVPGDALAKWQQAIKILLMTLVTMCMITTRMRIQALIWVVVASLGFYGVKGGLFSIMTGGIWRVWGPQASFIGDNNSLALALLMILPLIRHLQAVSTQAWVRAGLWAAAGLTVLAILGTYSRGGVVGLVVMLPILLLKGRQRVVTFLILAGVLAAAVPLMPAHWFNRMASIAQIDTDLSMRGRIEAWTFAFRLALDHPIVGGGFRVFLDEDLFRSYVPQALTNRNFHSIYFEVLAENGFVGLALFLGLGVSAMMTTWRIDRLTRGRQQLAWANSLARMIQVAVVGYAVGGIVLNFGFFDLYYTLVAVAVGAMRVVQAELAGAGGEDAAAWRRAAAMGLRASRMHGAQSAPGGAAALNSMPGAQGALGGAAALNSMSGAQGALGGAAALNSMSGAQSALGGAAALHPVPGGTPTISR